MARVANGFEKILDASFDGATSMPESSSDYAAAFSAVAGRPVTPMAVFAAPTLGR